MLPKKSYFIGVQILVLVIHTAQSLVVLTANVEDIRRLARKFVKEELIGEIAEIVGKGSTDFGPYNSDGALQSVAREHRPAKKTRYIKERDRQVEVPFKRLSSWEREGNNDIDTSFDHYKSKNRPKKHRPLNTEFPAKDKVRHRDVEKSKRIKSRLKQSKDDYEEKPPSHKRKRKPLKKPKASKTNEIYKLFESFGLRRSNMGINNETMTNDRVNQTVKQNLPEELVSDDTDEVSGLGISNVENDETTTKDTVGLNDNLKQKSQEKLETETDKRFGPRRSNTESDETTKKEPEFENNDKQKSTEKLETETTIKLDIMSDSVDLEKKTW